MDEKRLFNQLLPPNNSTKASVCKIFADLRSSNAMTLAVVIASCLFVHQQLLLLEEDNYYLWQEQTSFLGAPPPTAAPSHNSYRHHHLLSLTPFSNSTKNCKTICQPWSCSNTLLNSSSLSSSSSWLLKGSEFNTSRHMD